jgi:hypothetical protein
MLRCVDRYARHPDVKLGDAFRMTAPMPRPLGGSPYFNMEPHGSFEIVGFCAATEQPDRRRGDGSRGNGHLALVKFRANGIVRPLALWIIEQLPRVYA